jgi:hypothetical protein
MLALESRGADDDVRRGAEDYGVHSSTTSPICHQYSEAGRDAGTHRQRGIKEVSALATRQAEMLQAQAQMYQSQTHMNNVMAEMADAQACMDAKMAEAQARTDERMAETDGRLNNLINIVEQYISERRNGNREG